MHRVLYYYILCYVVLVTATNIHNEEMIDAKVDSISNQVREIIEHYKQVEPVGLPGAPIPDPLPIPDLKHSRPIATLILKNATMNGLSKFKVEQLYSNLASMQVEVALKYTKLEVLGNYTLSTWVTRSAGGFNVTLTQVYLEGVASLEVARQGNLEATDIILDISVKDIALDFKNLGFLGAVFQGMINTVGTFVFDSIKPFILSEVNTNMRNDINKGLRTLKQTFPNSMPPIDLALAAARKLVREYGYDPYRIEDYKYNPGIISVELSNVFVSGLASFYRLGNLTISVSNNSLLLGVHLSTRRLHGSCSWELSLGGFLSNYGSASFSVEYLEVKTKINQSLNVRHSPNLNELQLSLGNIQLRMNGLGTLDYILELLSNVVPNLLRYQEELILQSCLMLTTPCKQ
uniref:Putative hemolymph juvenile hormone binding protein n=1 Tax=Panstrongylus lignarius TaxID=156445 RepID=A0A224XDJ0_9HEMI